MRESCKSGSVGEAAGDRRLYPTAALLRLPICRELKTARSHWPLDSVRHWVGSIRRHLFHVGSRPSSASLSRPLPQGRNGSMRSNSTVSECLLASSAGGCNCQRGRDSIGATNIRALLGCSRKWGRNLRISTANCAGLATACQAFLRSKPRATAQAGFGSSISLSPSARLEVNCKSRPGS